MQNSSNIVTRIAPSPTGNLHIGTARTALFNYLFAKKHGGSFIVRIEDTDKERGSDEFEADILNGLEWLGLAYDELYKQSTRGDVYGSYIKTLIKEDRAYVSKETSKQDPDKVVELVRLRNSGGKVTFSDEVRGEITFDISDLGDFVIARSAKDPLYHLAVVIDDAEMGVTHVIRGEDHISNTPRQILIQEALGFSRPIYAHIPLILSSDRSKMSKRKGDTSISKYAEEFLPEAMINYLALLGWNPGTEQELFKLSELVETFSLEKVQKGGAIFDIEKLKSINQEYLKKLSQKKFNKEISSFIPKKIKELDTYSEKKINEILPIVQERVRTFKEAEEMFQSGELDFYFKQPAYNTENIAWKDDNLKIAKEHLKSIIAFLESVKATDFNAENIKAAVWDYASENGRGSVLWPFRYALTGLAKSPDPFSVASVLGREETLERVQAAIKQT